MHLRVRSHSSHPTNQSFYYVRVDGEVQAPNFEMIWRDAENKTKVRWRGWADHRRYFPMRQYTAPTQGQDSDLFIEFPELGHQYVYQILSGVGQWYFEFTPVHDSLPTWPAVTVEHGFFSQSKYLVLVNDRVLQGLTNMLECIANPVANHYWHSVADADHAHFNVSIILDMDMTNDRGLSMQYVRIKACKDTRLVDLFNVLCGPQGSDNFYLHKIEHCVKTDTMRLGELQYSKLAARAWDKGLVEAYGASEGTELKLFPLQSSFGQRECYGWLICHPNCQLGEEGQQMELDTTRAELVSQTEALDPEVLDSEAPDAETLDLEVLNPEALDTETLDPGALDSEVLDPEILEPEALGAETLDPEAPAWIPAVHKLDPTLPRPKSLPRNLGSRKTPYGHISTRRMSDAW